MKNQKSNVQKEETKKSLNSDLLSKVGALIASANIQQKSLSSNNDIFKKGFQEKSIRTKVRAKLFKYAKNVLLSVNDLNDLENAINVLSNHCNTYYIAESKFDKVQNYYTSQREDESTKENINILSTAFEIINNFNLLEIE